MAASIYIIISITILSFLPLQWLTASNVPLLSLQHAHPFDYSLSSPVSLETTSVQLVEDMEAASHAASTLMSPKRIKQLSVALPSLLDD